MQVPRGTGPYLPNLDPAISMLGTTQWNWLQKQLTVPAEIRLIVSSIQVIPEDHNWESWSMMSTERAYLFQIIEETRAQGVIFLSGDRHQAELSKLDEPYTPYPLYDLTASSFNRPGLASDEPNRHRIGKRHPFANYGLLDIDWRAENPTVTMRIFDPEGGVHVEHRVTLAELMPRD